MKVSINLGATPVDEPCTQVGDPNYDMKAMAECERFIALLRRVYGVEPPGCRLYVKAHNHDFGIYHEVELEFEDTDGTAMKYVMAVEPGCSTWEG